MYDAIVIGVGGMGSAIVGRIMADFCLDRPPRWDIARFRLTPERLA